MRNPHHELRRDEILQLAHEARLLIQDGELCYLNDLATEKELLAFARLVEARRSAHRPGS